MRSYMQQVNIAAELGINLLENRGKFRVSICRQWVSSMMSDLESKFANLYLFEEF